MMYTWNKDYQTISQMRDEQREIELLHLIESKKYYYALADLGYKQLKDLLVRKILALDEKSLSNDMVAYQTMEYGRLLTYIIQEENSHKVQFKEK